MPLLEACEITAPEESLDGCEIRREVAL
jgi:hypothetical protein